MAIIGRYVTQGEFFAGLGGEKSVRSVEPDDVTLTAALTIAEDTFDSYLTKRYFLPQSIAQASSHVKTLVLALAKFYIKEVSANVATSEDDEARIQREIAFLDKVRLAKPDSPIVKGLVERRKTGELRGATQELSVLRQPVQSGRLDGLRPLHDTINHFHEDFFGHHGHGHGRGFGFHH